MLCKKNNINCFVIALYLILVSGFLFTACEAKEKNAFYIEEENKPLRKVVYSEKPVDLMLQVSKYPDTYLHKQPDEHYWVNGPVFYKSRVKASAKTRVGSNVWYKVHFKTNSGWLPGDELEQIPEYAKKLPEVSLVIAKSGLNMREKPEQESPLLASIPFRAKVRVLEEHPQSVRIGETSGHWLRVLWQDKKGWVFGPYVKKRDPCRKLSFFFDACLDIGIETVYALKEQFADSNTSGSPIRIPLSAFDRLPCLIEEDRLLVLTKSDIRVETIAGLYLLPSTLPHICPNGIPMIFFVTKSMAKTVLSNANVLRKTKNSREMLYIASRSKSAGLARKTELLPLQAWKDPSAVRKTRHLLAERIVQLQKKGNAKLKSVHFRHPFKKNMNTDDKRNAYKLLLEKFTAHIYDFKINASKAVYTFARFRHKDREASTYDFVVLMKKDSIVKIFNGEIIFSFMMNNYIYLYVKSWVPHTGGINRWLIRLTDEGVDYVTTISPPISI